MEISESKTVSKFRWRST